MFKGGDLLLDSGVYSGDGLSDHDQNYYVRTIAHNTLVVHNPSENFQGARPDAVSNDGGQRPPYPASRSPQTLDYFREHAKHYDTGDVTRVEDHPLFTYAVGDATGAYNNPSYHQAMDTGLSGNTAKVGRFVRELAYLRPFAGSGEYVLLADRVAVTQAGFSGEATKLLFHSLDEPVVSGAGAEVSPGETLYRNPEQATLGNGDAKLLLKPLLPTSRNLRKVGGRGVKAFWVFGTNHDWHWTPSEPQPRPTNDFEEVPYGEWRLELEPSDTALAHLFLTLLRPSAGAAPPLPATTVIQDGGLAGVYIADPALGRVVLFSAADDGAPPAGTLHYRFGPTSRTHHSVFDLAPGGRYAFATSLAGSVRTVTLTPSPGGALEVSAQGVLSFFTDEDPGLPQARLEITAATPAAGQGVAYTDLSTGNPTSWMWRFGDGTSSSERHPSHTYRQPGRYWPSLVVTNAVGTSATAREVVVTQDGPADLIVTLAAPLQPVLVGDEATFVLQVVNQGPAPASGVSAVIELPAGTAFASAQSSQGNCHASETWVVCPLGRLDPSGTATLAVVLTLLTSGTITVRGEASHAGADPVTENNLASSTFQVGHPPPRVRRHLGAS